MRLFRGRWDPALVWEWRPEGTSSRPSRLVGQHVRVRPPASSAVRLVFSLACGWHVLLRLLVLTGLA